MIKFLDLTPQPELAAELQAAYNRVMTSGRYIGGPEVEGFEAEWARYLNVSHCVGCGNGFDALQLILRAYDIGYGDNVLAPTHTCKPTWAAVAITGAEPIGYDDIEDIPAIVEGDKSIKAIIAVHLYGIPADIDRIQELKCYPHIRVIEDAAQAHGSVYKGRKCGTLADAAAWSFYPTKNLGAYGDAGAVTTNDATLAARVRSLGNYGESGAINSRLDPLQAALLRVKLGWLDEWNKQRQRNAITYFNGFHPSSLPINPLNWMSDGTNYHQYVIQIKQRRRVPREEFMTLEEVAKIPFTPADIEWSSEFRSALRQRLAARNIETMIHYPRPPHLDFGYKRGDFPKAEHWADTVLSLPVGPHLGDADIMRVVEAIKELESG